MPFKVHDDMPMPGRRPDKSLTELIAAVKDLEVGQCLEVDIKDMNWSNREPGFRPERKHVLSRLGAATTRIRKAYPNRKYASRPITDTSLGVWRLEDRDA